MPKIFGYIDMDNDPVMQKSVTSRVDSPKRGKIIWTSFICLDTYLSKTFLIEILTKLAKLDYDVSLIAVRSRNRFELKDSKIHVIPIPVRYVPVISPFIFSVVLSLFLPIYVILSKPDFIIMTSLYDPSILV